MVDGIIGFGQNDSAVTRKNSNFKGETNKKYRLSFVWWNTNDDGTPDFNNASPNMVAKNRIYIKGAGYLIPKGNEFNDLAGTAPRPAIATVVVKWPLDRQGAVDKAALKSRDYEVLTWIFSKDKYTTLKDQHMECHFGEFDVMVRCNDANFQKMTFSPSKGNLYRQLLEKGNGGIGQKIQEEAEALANNINDAIGRTMTVDQVKEKLGMETSSPTLAGNDVVGDLDDVLDDALDDL